MNYRLLHIRSLNHLSRDHRFAYIGARILAESLHPSILGPWTNEYIARKAQTGRRQVYWKHSLFKGFNERGIREYRKCIVGSPTTCLTEVWLLNRLTHEAIFAQCPNVYSYYLSHDKSTNIYKYYLTGYLKREHQIARAALETKDAHVLILDLKRFYPSIDVSKVRQRFAVRIEQTSLSPSERGTANQCVEELTSIKHEVGLPIGPPLSHLLANVYLEELDKKLDKEYGNKYFRYVDDIALVISRSELETAQRFFETVSSEEGLKVNPDKVDILSGTEWAARVSQREQAGEDAFLRLLRDLRRYLAHNTEDFDRVRDMFRAEGFILPFSRLRSVAFSSSPFRRFLKGLWSQSGEVFGENVPRPPVLIETAKQLRRQFERHFLQVIEQPLPSGGMARRWALQDIRFVMNRLLYLLPAEKRDDMLDLIPECMELRPSKAVLEALVSGDASELTKYPGPTVSAFCELWTETTTSLPNVCWSSDPDREERDAASILALCGLCTPPEEWVNQLRERSSRVMVNLSARRRPTGRSFDDFSFIDEMESLMMKPSLDIDYFLATRFDDGEDVFLPTLSLGGGQYIS